MKKVIFGVLILCIALFAVYIFNTNVTTKTLKGIDLSKVETLTIESFPPGTKKVISDEEQISKIIEYFRSLKLKETTSQLYNGVNYRIYINEDKSFLFSISGDRLLYYNKWYYIGSNATDDFEALLK